MKLYAPHFSGTTLRELASLAFPMVISQGAHAVMLFTDRLFMSRIDAVHMAASLGGGIAAFFGIALFTGLLAYGNALVAQYYGAGANSKCSKVVTQGFFVSCLCTPIVLIIGYGIWLAFAQMGHDLQQVKLERIYFSILISACSISLFKSCIASYFSGIGRTKIVMTAEVIGMIVNVPVSYMLIFGGFGFSEWGIAGAALGTVIGNLVALLIFVGFYFERDHARLFKVQNSFCLDKMIFKRYFRLGLPSGLETFLNIAAFNIFLLMFQSYGVAAGASAAIVFNWDIVSFVPLMGLNIGVISLIGRFVGAKDMTRTDEVMFSGFLIAILYSSCLAVCFILFRDQLVNVFATPNGDFEEIRSLSTFMMVGMASYVIADAVILVSSGVLRGAGDTRWLMYSSIIQRWLQLIIQYFVIVVYEMKAEISWLVFVASIIINAIIYFARLKRGKWRKPKALEKVMAE